MKFVTANLIQALVSVKPGLSMKDVVSNAKDFVFRPGILFTTNDEINVSYPLENDLEMVIGAERFYKFLCKVNIPEIDIEYSAPIKVMNEKAVEVLTNTVSIKGGKFVTTLPLSSADPNLKNVASLLSPDIVWNKIPDSFMDMCKMLLISVGTDLSKPVLTCIHWTPDVIEACDNFRITRYDVKTPGVPVEGILIPSSSFDQLKNYDPIEFFVDDAWIHFKTSTKCIFSCRIFNGTYSNLDPILTMEADSEKLNFNKALIEILSRATEIAIADAAGSEQAKISVRDKTLFVEVVNQEGGVFTEHIRFNYSGTLEFEIRTKTLMSILERHSIAYLSKEHDRLKFTDGNMTYLVALLPAS